MVIYTRTGDDGTTSLFGGDRVHKSDRRIDAYGTVDELNAAVGLAAVASDPPAVDALRQVQHDLFVIGAHLATPPDSPSTQKLPPLDETIVGRLEMQIDAADAQLPTLRAFILPGGCELAARLHLARTVCRRAERLVVRFSEDRPVSPLILTYLNRLGDWLFVQARLANHRQSIPDIPWQKPRVPTPP